MTYSFADTSTQWILLLLFFVGIVGVVIFSFKVFLLTQLNLASRHHVGKLVVRSSVYAATFAVAGSLSYSSLFSRFSTLRVDEDKITLKYVWPKADIVISIKEIASVRTERDRKGKGDLIISTSLKSQRSVACLKSVDLDAPAAAIRFKMVAP